MTTTTPLPEIQSEYDLWNVAMRYWVRVDDWALVGGVNREIGAYLIKLNQYPNEGLTYRQAAFAVEPPGGCFDLDDYAARLAKAHGIEAPDWLAPSLHEIVRRLDADWEKTR